VSPPNIAYSALLLIAGTTCLFVAIIILQARQKATGAVALTSLLLALAWWDTTYGLFWSGTPGLTKYFWLDATYIGVVIVPAALFVFSLQITNKQDWLKRPLSTFIYLEPVFVLISLLTDPYHGLFFAGKREENSAMILDAGPIFWLNVVYSYALILFVTIVIVRSFFRSSGIYRKQLGIILLGIAFSWLNSIIFFMGLRPLPNADNTPFSFTITAVAFAFAVGKYHLLELIPVARGNLVEKMTEGVLVIDTHDRIVDMNPAAQRLLNINVNMFGRPVEEVINNWRRYEEITSNFKQNQIEIELDGISKKQVDMQVASIADGGKKDVGRLITLHDVSNRRQVEEKLQQLSRAVEQSPASIVITDRKGRIEYVNLRFTEVTGYSREEAIGKNPRILKTDKTPPETHRQLWKALASGREWRGEFVNRKKNGEEYYESASISPIINSEGMITHYLAVKEDITRQKRTEQELRNKNQILQFQLEAIEKLRAELQEQAIRDPLTGLYNRRYLAETQERELARAVREGYPVSFVMIDIDNFKNVNDTFGHEVGDQVLQKLAALIQNLTRVGGIICRYGGEEILAILPNVTEETALHITDRWREAFMNLTLSAELGPVKATVSCGISTYPLHGGTANELIALADKAMYQAKAAGRNRVVAWQSAG
jgi:diguanylate cyclase (GGDEF)-like protein/PAS domain S-box-containing protein